VDEQGSALRPSILYCDQRASKTGRRHSGQMDLKSFYGITAIASAVLFHRETHVDSRPRTGIYRRTRHTLCAKDYINLRLTGQVATDFLRRFRHKRL